MSLDIRHGYKKKTNFEYFSWTSIKVVFFFICLLKSLKHLYRLSLMLSTWSHLVVIIDTYPQLFKHDIDVALNNSVWQVPDKCSVRRFIWKRSLAASSSAATPIAATTTAASTVSTATVRVAFSVNKSGTGIDNEYGKWKPVFLSKNMCFWDITTRQKA